MPTIPFNRIAPVLSAKHILGDTPATDKENIIKTGILSGEVLWRSRLDLGFRADFNSIEMHTNFKAAITETQGIQFLYTGTSAESANGSPSVSWGSLGNIIGDTPTTKINANISTSLGPTYILKASNFGFTIPSTATILGVVVRAKTDASGVNAIEDDTVKLIKGGTIQGDDKANTDDWQSNPNKQWAGGTLDLWGLTLTPTDINASNFGVAIAAKNITGTPYFADLYTIRITVLYVDGVTTKWQIKPIGQSWEDIPDGSQDIILSSALIEQPITIFKDSSDFTNNDLPADIQLIATSTDNIGLEIEVGTLDNNIAVSGNSVTGSASNYLFDVPYRIKSATHLLGSTVDNFVKQIDNPSNEIAFRGYVDPGNFSGDINNLEINCGTIISIDAGAASGTLTWQIKPIDETLWKNVHTQSVSLNITPTAFQYHEDLVPADFTGWTYGLRAPFEFRLIFSSSASGKTFTLTTNDDHNYCRFIGDVD